MTLSEYLIFLATSAHTSQECISGFVDDFSILTHAHVVLPPEVQHQATHHDRRYRLHWTHYVPKHNGRIIAVYLEDDMGSTWMGSWDCEVMRYRIIPCNMKMSSTLISPCADFPYTEKTTHNCGPIMFHPRDKTPVIPYITEVFEEDFKKNEKQTATLSFFKWSRDSWPSQDEFNPPEPSCKILKPIKLSISRKKMPTWHPTDT